MEQPTGMYAQVLDGALVLNDDNQPLIGGLPAEGYRIVDGETCPVSNFHCLTDAELATAIPPRFPVVADEPAYDPETERLSAPTYTVRESDVLAEYTVEAIPPEPGL